METPATAAGFLLAYPEGRIGSREAMHGEPAHARRGAGRALSRGGAAPATLSDGTFASRELICLTGIRLATWIVSSPFFRSVLIPHLKPWLTANWERILWTQRVLLRSPCNNRPTHRGCAPARARRRKVRGSAFPGHCGRRRAPLDPGLRWEELERMAHGAA